MDKEKVDAVESIHLFRLLSGTLREPDLRSEASNRPTTECSREGQVAATVVCIGS